ncbi:MAG: DUF58 domain-containing protein [Firmicutes bacterium]|nr:DUF58 domain-containing protein [Bacillota bacterium]
MRKRWMGLALWLAAAALLWLFENNAATLTVLAASALLPLISIALAKGGAGGMSLSLTLPDEAQKGSALKAFLSAGKLRPFFRVSGRVSCLNGLTGERSETEFSRIPGRRPFEFDIYAKRCGTLRFTAKARAEDFFGLWRSKPLGCEEEFLTVEPRLFLPSVTLEESTTVISEGEAYSQTRPGSDPSETFAIREYLPGDPIRQIHWKLSQKSDELLVRELGLPVVNHSLLVLRNLLGEGESVDPAKADAMAEVFLSISHALVGEGIVHAAAFAEAGQFAAREIASEEDLSALKSDVLALSWEEDDGLLSRFLAEIPYAHAAVVSSRVPYDAQSFGRGNRVTVLSASPSPDVPGIYTLCFTPENYAEELRCIEL